MVSEFSDSSSSYISKSSGTEDIALHSNSLFLFLLKLLPIVRIHPDSALSRGQHLNTLLTLHTKNMGLKNLSKVCHIDKFWVVISMVPKTTSLRLSRRVSVAKLVKRSSSRTKQYISVSNYFYFFTQKKRQKGHNKNY